jgi:hypothetical protein
LKLKKTHIKVKVKLKVRLELGPPGKTDSLTYILPESLRTVSSGWEGLDPLKRGRHDNTSPNR